MASKLENAKALYFEGIRDGNAREAVTRYTGERYTQHSTGVRDGVDGFVEFFEAFFERNPIRDIQIPRALEDGQFVFVHAFQNINNGETRWVTADIFDTDSDNRIIEHWDVIQAYDENPESGIDMVSGPQEVEDLERTEPNRKVVQGFIQDTLIGSDAGSLSSYLDVSVFEHHSPRLPRGLGKFGPAATDSAMQYIALHQIVAQGNFVACLCEVTAGDDQLAVIDLYRLQSGKIVEHWDVQEKILPEDQWGNSGKF